MLVLIPPMSALQASQHSNINLSCLARPSSILKSPGVSYEHLAVTVAMPAACWPAAVSSGVFLWRAGSPGQLKWYALNAIPGHRQLLGASQIEVAAEVLESPVTAQHGNTSWATVNEFVPEGFHLLQAFKFFFPPHAKLATWTCTSTQAAATSNTTCLLMRICLCK